MRKIRIFCYANDPNSSVSLYRVYGPLGHLARNYPDQFEITPIGLDDLKWPTVNLCDILFISRITSTEGIARLQSMKDFGAKIVVDWDDDDTCVQTDNKMYIRFVSERIQQNLKTILNLADHVIVSTEAIKQSYARLTSKPITVVKNAIDTRWFKHFWEEFKDKEHDNGITWRGGDSHFKDLLSISKPLFKLNKRHPNQLFRFYGYHPFHLTDYLTPGSYSVEMYEIISFHRKLHECKSPVGFVPLQDHQFNRAKSNIAWLELTSSKHAVLARELPEFIIPGVMTYKTEDEFFQKMEHLIEDKSLQARNRKLSFEVMMDVFTLDKINEQRKRIFSEVASST